MFDDEIYLVISNQPSRLSYGGPGTVRIGADGQASVAPDGGGGAGDAYNIGFSFVGGVLGASQLLGLHRFVRAVTLPANASGSVAGATANASASTVISIDRALNASPTSFSQVGTITFAAGGVAATFATSGAVAFASGDVLRLQGPATADSTLANVYCTLVGQ